MSPSNFSSEFNWLFWVMVALCGTVATAIAAVVVYSAVRYHRKRENELPPHLPTDDVRLETAWTVIPFVLFLGMFTWGTKMYFDIERPPDDALQVYVIAKQWMWETQQLDGAREINELHVPVGRDIKLLMASQDVIHSFYVPAFHIKQDVLPGRYTSIWFRADKPGKYHLFCAEYCGTNHSHMIGWIYALPPHQYQHWLQEGGAEGSLASDGEKLFHQFGCANCHHFDGHGRCPNLRGLFGTTVRLAGGDTAVVDASYIRRKLFDVKSFTVEGYEKNIMPDFSHQLTEEDAIQLIAYIKSLGASPGSTIPSSSGNTNENYGSQPGITYSGAPPLENQTPGMR
jgi:cytochrome c oxidase subunit II